MNQEYNEGVRADQTDISPLAKLEAAIQEYMHSLGDDRPGAGGMLTGWLLVTEEQNPISGTCSQTKVARDLQTFTTSLGLVSFLDKLYSARVMRDL